MKRLISLVVVLVLVVIGAAAFFFLSGSTDPSPGCVDYAYLQNEVLESNRGISRGQLEFKKGEVLVVEALPVGESPAGVRMARYGGEIVAESESVPVTLRYEIEENGVDIFPITNMGPGSISISVSCE